MLDTIVRSTLAGRWAVALLTLLWGAGGVSPLAAQSGSNATNYGNAAQISVNGRTGDLTLATTLFKIPGIVSELDNTLALTYRSEDARSNIQNNMRVFGLPFGWSLGLSFIYVDGTSTKLNIDGTQAYQLDDNWRTSFLPVGASAPLSIRTGLRQYNRADAHLRPGNGSVTVNGLGSAYVFTTLEGQTKYFSPGGLLIRHGDRFGNHIDYHYRNRVTGGNAGNSTTAANAELGAIIDTWGNTTSIDACLDPTSCVANETRVTLPDGRTVGWVTPDAFTVEQIIDTEGMVTHLGWENSTCDDLSYGNRKLTNVTLPSGGMTALRYESCLPACESPSASECSVTTSWSVVSEMIQCPNNTSGEPCPGGSNGDQQTTRYHYRTTEDIRNYTGYPRYSMFEPSVSGADALMSAPDAGSFTYTTVITQHSATGETIHRVESDYNFLHLEQEQRIYVADGTANGLVLSKVLSHCYPISDGDPSEGCPLTAANYSNLPSNYQSPIVTGSCVFNSSGDGNGRLSVVSMAHDGFGNVVNKRTYHGTRDTGIMNCAQRSERLGPSGLKLMRDEYMEYDTSSSVDTDQYLKLGPGSGHFGLPVGQLSFVYLDNDETEIGAHGSLGDREDPILVKLVCNTITRAATGEAEELGTNIKAAVHGLLANDTEQPAVVGVVEACANPEIFDETVAPPKATTYVYDESGRGLGHVTEWAGRIEPQGIDSTSARIDYELGSVSTGEAKCGDGRVLQVTTTDSQNNVTVNRVCTENGFHLSSRDANGNPTFIEHSANGMATKTLQANGTFTTTDYYYACPVAQDGSTSTCPEDSSVLKKCPSQYDSLRRNCAVHTIHAGSNNDSYVDGVIAVSVRDGLGRTVTTLDNTAGANPGTGFSALQVRSVITYDDRGLLVSKTNQMGAAARNPLVYQTTTSFGPKLRPKMVCGPRGTAHEFVHDDVNQKVKSILNGTDREAYTLNDGQKLTSIANCDIVDGSSTSTNGACPTVAAETDSAECAGDAYMTYTLYDGAGVPHSIAATAGDQLDEGASVTSVHGVTTFSADMLKYAYNFTSNASGDGTVTADSRFVRDLQGQKLEHFLDITTDQTKSFSSDRHAYNEINELVSERNKLSDDQVTLEETYEYNPLKQVSKLTSYEGVEFHNYYDKMNRLVRHCFQPSGEDAQGERLTLDPVTGAILRIAKFTNPGSCSDDDSGDVETGDFEEYTYNRFGTLERIQYADGTILEWAFDQYQRPSCFADALATAHGGRCPASPTQPGFSPSSSELLVSYSYYADSDTYRRGLIERTCRGVPDGSGGTMTRCIESDYYTPVSPDGHCPETGLSVVTGAFAGLLKSETFCTGAPCDAANTIYTTTHTYDEHRRPCVVESVNQDGQTVLSSSFRYDQYNNLVHEESRSDLVDEADEGYTQSNYQVDYVYDGLLRVIEEDRTDLDGNLIKNTQYKYDAASNLIEKLETYPDPTPPQGTPPGPLPSATAITATPALPSPTGAASTPTRAVNTPVPTDVERADDDGCQISPPEASPIWVFLLALTLGAVLRRRRVVASTR